MFKIGARIREVRTQKGVSLCQLANLASISKGYLSNIENNKNQPSQRMIIKIAQSLEISVEAMMSHHEGMLDDEWVGLVRQAKEMGLSSTEVRAFLLEQTIATEVKQLLYK
ncbi:transcriptional regulator SinR [Fictibacillus macauensis ZFHKF-1]|uniref:Transcriptional regulator SinR n=1 Tax=Fictibacillus macauensis ZFHKF-1 TaxID=1196324 RepID=I8AIQ9_9BACL|nr:helix-turn-helix domain-containing protein [Fictibacillus macauensis]EIT85622.1 transcriptional regulator SinR [Fictibacillus macauensis ZFHKF-1]